MNLPGKTIEVIFFDAGDTLIVFEGDWERVIKQSIEALWQSLNSQGIHLEKERFMHDFAHQMQSYYAERDQSLVEITSTCVLIDTLAAHGIQEPDEDVIKTALKDMYAISQRHWKLDPAAIDLLTHLKKENFRLGLISNASDRDDVYTLLRQHNIIDFFEIILVSAESGFRKPHAAMFQAGLQFFNIHPGQCMMVGDRLEMDIQGARTLGMHTAWINRQGNSLDQRIVDHFKPDMIITSLNELKQYFAGNKPIL